MNSACFTCQLPDCDDTDARCAVRQAKRKAGVGYTATWRQRHLVEFSARKIVDARDRRIERIALLICARVLVDDSASRGCGV